MADIFSAIRAKDLDALTSVVDAGAPLNKYQDELTPLGLAAQIGFVAGVEYLLGLYETKANKGRSDGASPLMIATEKDRKNTLIKMLLYPSVDINHKDKDGNAAIHIAIMKDSADSFKVLVANGSIDLDLANKERKTPLLIAAEANKPKFVEALLKAGADATFEHDGMAIYEKARRNRFDRTISQMIVNMVVYEQTYNMPLEYDAVTAVAGLPSLRLDIYPLTKKGESFVGRADPGVEFNRHTAAEGEANMEEFLRILSLTRGMCGKTVENNYAMLKLPKVDFYIALTYDDPVKLVGFVYVSIYRTDRVFFIDLICTRSTVKGAGAYLMNACLGMAVSKGYKELALDSVPEAVTFYEKFGLVAEEQTMDNIIADVFPMRVVLPEPSSAAGAAAATRRNSAGAAGKKTTRKKRSKRVVRS
jgi:hypothetical protein